MIMMQHLGAVGAGVVALLIASVVEHGSCSCAITPDANGHVTITSYAAYGSGFAGCDALQSVTIQTGILPDRVFMNCTNLVNVQSTNFISVGAESAFEGCTSLEFIDLQALASGAGRYSWSTSFEFRPRMFAGCSRLVSVVMPTSGILYSNVFEGCACSVPTYAIGVNVSNCTAASFAPVGPPSFAPIAPLPYYPPTVVGETWGTTAPSTVGQTGGSCAITPDVNGHVVVTSDGYGSGFAGCYALRSVTIQSGAPIDIPDRVFMNCTNLVNVQSTNYISRGGESAFEGCTSLEFIDLQALVSGGGQYPSNDLIFGPRMFAGCSRLASIVMPNYLSWLTDDAFEGCACTIPTYVRGARVSNCSPGNFSPTISPSYAPSAAPADTPTAQPTIWESQQPTQPTTQPSTNQPTNQPNNGSGSTDSSGGSSGGLTTVTWIIIAVVVLSSSLRPPLLFPLASAMLHP
jgi:hypothetical protein